MIYDSNFTNFMCNKTLLFYTGDTRKGETIWQAISLIYDGHFSFYYNAFLGWKMSQTIDSRHKPTKLFTVIGFTCFVTLSRWFNHLYLFFHPSISQLYLWIPPKLYDRGSCIITQRGTFILYICGHVLAYC